MLSLLKMIAIVFFAFLFAYDLLCIVCCDKHMQAREQLGPLRSLLPPQKATDP